MPSWTYTGTDANQTPTGAIDKGYYVKLPNVDPQENKPSAEFIDRNNETISMWFTKVNIGFEVGGSYGQSARLRQWFPRNMIQPIITVEGICPNSFQYQRLGQYVRETQLQAIEPKEMAIKEFVRLRIFKSTLGEGVVNSKNQIFAKGFGKGKELHPFVQGKGGHSEWSVHGLIENFKRGAERFKNAPTYEFSFMILYAESLNNIFNINTVSPGESRLVNEFNETQGILNNYKLYGAPTATRPKS